MQTQQVTSFIHRAFLNELPDVQHMLETQATLPFYIQCLLSRYYVLHWSAAYFSLQYSVYDGHLYHQDVRYKVAFKKGHKDKLVKRDTIAILSFRNPTKAATKELGLQAIVFISLR